MTLTIDRLRKIADGTPEVRNWRCLACGCHSFARMDTLQPSGLYAPGFEIRCLSCKAVTLHPDDQSELVRLALIGLETERRSTKTAGADEGWQDISTLPEGEHVALWFPHGERGIGGIEMASVFFDGDDWAYWTHGGPNSGIDWYPRDDENPTMWRVVSPPQPAVQGRTE